MTYKNILVLGGTGFIGRCLVERLVARGCTVCVPTRRRVNGRPLFVLPTVEVVEVDIHDPRALRALLAGRDAVVNLVGILHDTGRAARGAHYGPMFAAAHGQLPRALVAACQEQGVRRLLHVSALGADSAGPSGYLRSKGDGERVVREARDIDATVFRPSVVFGAGDGFLNLFAALAAVLPVLFIGRSHARLQPVSVQDLAQAMEHALDRRETFGRTYEICGPTVYTLAELVRFAAAAAGHPRLVVGLPAVPAAMMAYLLEWLPGPPLLSRDNLRSLSVDSVATVQPYRAAPELGFDPRPMEPVAALYLGGMHPRTRFAGFRARARR
jgi:uncharacterized protein YbjT (DUF2867 family)